MRFDSTLNTFDRSLLTDSHTAHSGPEVLRELPNASQAQELASMIIDYRAEVVHHTSSFGFAETAVSLVLR